MQTVSVLWWLRVWARLRAPEFFVILPPVCQPTYSCLPPRRGCPQEKREDLPQRANRFEAPEPKYVVVEDQRLALSLTLLVQQTRGSDVSMRTLAQFSITSPCRYAITQPLFPETNALRPPARHMHLPEVPIEYPPDDFLRDHSGCRCC